jgi:Flp pilus assembly protein TadB
MSTGTILVALMFGIGAYLIVISFGANSSSSRVKEMMDEHKKNPDTAEMTVFKAILADLGQKLSREKGDLLQLLIKSGYLYANPAEYYARRMLSALIYFMLPLTAAFFFKLSFTTTAILMTAAAVWGFIAPRNGLMKAINRRREQLLKEMGFGLERISVSLTSGADMTEALMSASKLGIFGEITSHLANQISLGRSIKDVADEIRASMPETPELNEFLEMTRIGMARGTDIAPIFRTLADSQRQRLRLEVMREGQRAKNNIAAITSGLTIFAVFVTILGPIFIAFFTTGAFA